MATAVLDLERAYDDAAACEPDGVAEEAEGDVEHHAGQPVSRGRDGEDESDGGGVGDDDGGTSGAEGDSDDDGEGGPQSVQRGRGRGRGRRGREGWGVGGSGRGRADAAPGGSDGDDDSDGARDDDAEDSGGEGEGGGAREECATTAYSAAELQDLFERITDGAPENTKKAYRTQFNKFVDHCKAAKVDPAKLYSHALGAVAGKFFRKLTLSKAGRSTLANARSVLVLLDAANRLQLGQELGQEEAANMTPVADDVVFRKAFKAAMSLSVGQKVKARVREIWRYSSSTLGDAGADAETVPRVGPRRAAADGSGTSDALTSPHQALLSLHGFDVMPPAAGGDHPSASLRTAHWAPRFAVSIPPPLLEKCKLSLFPFLPELRARVASIPAAVQAQRPSVPNVLAAVEWIGECCVQDTLELAQTAPSNPLVRRLYWKVPEWAGLLQSYIGAEREILATKPRDVLEVLDDVQAALDKLIAAGRAQGRASDLETRPQEQEQAGVVLAAAVQASGPPQAARSPGVEGIYLGGSLSGGGGGLSVLQQQQQQQMAQAWAAATDSGGVGGGGGGFPVPLGAASAAPIGVFWHHEHQQQQHQQQQQQAARSLGTGSGLGGGGGPSGGVGARSILQQLELCAKMLQQARAAAADSSGGGGGGGPSGGIGALSLLQQLELCAATLQQAQLAQARAAAADGGGGGGGSFPSLPRTASAVPTDLAQMVPPSELIRELPNRTSTHDGFGSAASGFCGANGGGLGAQQQQQARAAAADSSGGGGGGAFPVSGGGLGAFQAAPGAGAGAGPRRDSPTSFGGPGMPSGLGCDMSGGDLWHLQQQQHLQQQHHQQQLQTARSLGTDGGLGGGGGVGGGLLRPAGGQGAVWQHHSAAAAAGGGGLAAGLHHSAAAAGGGGGGLAAGSGPGRGSATWVGAAPVVGATAVAAAPSSSRALFPPGSWSALRGTAAVAAAAGGMLPGGAAPSTQPVQQQPVIFLTVTQSSMVSPPAAFPLLPASASSSERVPELRHLGSGLRPWPAGLRTVSELFRVMHLGQPGPRIPALMTLQGQYGDDWRRGFDPHIRKRWHELLFVYDQCVVQTQKVRGGTLNDAAEYWTAWMQYKKIGSVAGLYKYLKETLGKQDGPTLQQLVAVNREPGVVSPPKQAAPAAAVATSGGGGGGGGREVGGGPVGRRVTGYMLYGNHVRSEASKAGVSLEQQALAADPGMDMRKAANQAVKQIAALWGALSAEEKARWNAQAAGAAVGGDE
ncbi:hypothetical protein PLESTB_001281500 [Pleodorina starrii]|uniref:Uncharacterized protein n=1 Tax=Pleodorina starrii TaxID=330485 RepID=A0A9W6F6T9_9CHLO|nr:hypothetical protein PLESTB_001281500 [Pleodorina starrii]